MGHTLKYMRSPEQLHVLIELTSAVSGASSLAIVSSTHEEPGLPREAQLHIEPAGKNAGCHRCFVNRLGACSPPRARR